MANPLSLFISDRFIQPAVDARVERALSKQPVAYGSSVVQEQALSQVIGQPHDADYPLLYALYKLNTNVSGSVSRCHWPRLARGSIVLPGESLCTGEESRIEQLTNQYV
jgi:hypothetical protein